MVQVSSASNPEAAAAERSDYRFPLTALTSLFFMWGFITCLNDILIPHLKAVFELSYTQAMLVQFCFFGAYFIVSLPAGKLIKRIGFQKGIVTGLVVASCGCAAFYPAANLQSYPLFLAALFILAAGITLLQVSANPLVVCLGPASSASSRLTLTQAFNSFGTTLAPFFGAWLILAAAGSGLETIENNAEGVKLPYLLLASTLAVLAVLFSLLKLPGEKELGIAVESNATETVHSGSAWQFRHLQLGALAIFLYVGAEVSIGSFLISFFALESIAGLQESEAAYYVAYYWGGAMVGRFLGAIIMRKFNPGKYLGLNALIAATLVLVAIVANGQLAMWAILLVGLCNAIMFPTIFSLSLNDLGAHTSQGSGILCLSIVGGAVVPLFQGLLADAMDVQIALIVPFVCYFYIAHFGFVGHRKVRSS
jgi:FHS family L-fucose permease-like MFS transporter